MTPHRSCTLPHTFEQGGITNMISGRRNLLITVSFGLLAALIVWTTVLLISRAFTSLPYYDSWGLYPDAIPSLQVLFHGHNEHIIATIRVCFWLDKVLTSSSGIFTISCIFLSCAIPVVAIFLLVRAHGKEYRPRAGDNLILALGLLCIAYAGIQFTNLVWQFQIGFVSAYTLSLAALCCQATSISLSHGNSSWGWLAAALVFATLASYGLFGGTLVWPAMVAFAWLGRRRRQLVIILVTGTIVAIPYIANLLSAPPSHGIGEGKVVKFLLAWLGSPVGGMLDTNYLPIGALPVRVQVGAAAATGVLTLLAFAYLSLQITPLLERGKSARGTMLLLPLWLFGWIVLVSGLLAAIGRSYLPLNEAISSRYTTPPLILWACMFGLWLQLARMDKLPIRFFRASLLIISIMVLASQPNKVIQSGLHGARMAQVESAALNGVPDLDVMSATYPTPETVIPRIAKLNAAKVSIFRPDAWPALGEDTSGWRSIASQCKVKVATQVTSYGKTFWRAELTAPLMDYSWRLVYIHDQKIVGLGAPEDRRGIHTIPSQVSHWIGYAPDAILQSNEGTFAVVSTEQKALARCISE